MIPLVGFLPPTDERVLGTARAVEARLLEGGFVRRYESDRKVDGLPEGEGVFLPCTFWLADNWALMGRESDARALFERLVGLSNDVGLLSEEYDVTQKRLVGNFPQAFSHVALVNTARSLSPAARRPGRARPQREVASRSLRATRVAIRLVLDERLSPYRVAHTLANRSGRRPIAPRFAPCKRKARKTRMRPLFQPWSDTVFRLALTGAVATAVAVPDGDDALGPHSLCHQQDEPVVQPIAFDHRYHVRDDGIDCLYCHYEATRSPYAGAPPTEVCMNCHKPGVAGGRSGSRPSAPAGSRTGRSPGSACTSCRASSTSITPRT